MQTLFGENVCKNKRIGSHRGACTGNTPLRSANGVLRGHSVLCQIYFNFTKTIRKVPIFGQHSLDNFSLRVFCVIFCHHHHNNQFLSFLQPSSDEMLMTIAQLSCLLGFLEFRLEICVVLNISWTTCIK